MGSYQTAFQEESFLDGSATQTPEPRLTVVESTDRHLVDRVLKGDMGAFEDIFYRHRRLVAVVASRYFRRPEEIEELVQISFAKAYTEMDSFRGRFDRSLASWLSRITANACIDTLRSQRRKPERLHCDLAEHEIESLMKVSAESGPDAETAAANRDLADKLLRTISVEDRALLQMLYAEEMSVAQIAKCLGLSTSNVKVRAWRARRSLRRTLSKIL